jgi:hypothetical protein
MQRAPVVSSNLRSVGYDRASQTLEVEFQSGALYQYFGVPPEVYQALLAAPSHGSYFVANVRNAYPYQRLR